ncbi:hypothetical protein HYH02_010833 [Chlamydomonas schloesseri]|uniref:acylphosphatase n=1 Tax=Chlamydomonas schloesseri TaxID=2026947 RepID=A0A835T8L6_9CHLO|nr:hypothetical protein HYH02_010833 [Chlamydomonas schloesseri]|eukprot:KAG2438378.1 hypothetical protein HYH02_010833 [Chlamydomonas schloesseri]
MSGAPPLIGVKFEVFGKVDKVDFVKYAQLEAERLGLFGWIEETKDRTIKGEIEGPPEQVQEMQQWLCSKGSPGCQIDRVDASEPIPLQKPTHGPILSVKPHHHHEGK